MVEFIVFAGLAYFGFKIFKKIKEVKAEGRDERPTGSQESRSGKSSTDGVLGFQESGKEPQADAAGRVIVKLKSGGQVEWGVNLSRLSAEVAGKILGGKKEEDEEIEKTIRVRIRRDTKSQFSDSVLLETKKGEFIGWILKEDSPQAAGVIAELDEQLRKFSPVLADKEFTYEVSARVAGTWYLASDEDEPEELEAEVDDMIVRIAAPVVIEID